MLDEPTGSEVIDGYYEGPGIITDLNITGTNGEYLQISLTIRAAGAKAFVANTRARYKSRLKGRLRWA